MGELDIYGDDELEENEEMLQGFLVFDCVHHKYALGLESIREVIPWEEIIPVPDLPGFVKGMIERNGITIPMLDVRLRFSLPPSDYSDRTCFVIAADGSDIIGLIVDSADEVIQAGDKDMESPPDISHEIHSRFVSGVIRTGMILVLDLHNLIYNDEMSGVLKKITDFREKRFGK